jgi:hypothetical protein
MTDFDGRSQVEGELGRALTQDELMVVDSISQLSTTNLAVLRVLSRRQRLAALLYLRAVVPDASSPELNELINSHG